MNPDRITSLATRCGFVVAGLAAAIPIMQASVDPADPTLNVELVNYVNRPLAYVGLFDNSMILWISGSFLVASVVLNRFVDWRTFFARLTAAALVVSMVSLSISFVEAIPGGPGRDGPFTRVDAASAPKWMVAAAVISMAAGGFVLGCFGGVAALFVKGESPTDTLHANPKDTRPPK
jgi:hypothetical protein